MKKVFLVLFFIIISNNVKAEEKVEFGDMPNLVYSDKVSIVIISVYYKNGKTPAKGYEIKAITSGMGGGMIYSKTDKNGQAILSWKSGGFLDAIFIDGKKYNGTYKKGGNYTFILEK